MIHVKYGASRVLGVHIYIEKRWSINFCFHIVDWRAGVNKRSNKRWAKIAEWPGSVERAHGSGFKRFWTSQAPFIFKILFLYQCAAQKPGWVSPSHQNCLQLVFLGMRMDCPKSAPQQEATSVIAPILCFSSWPEKHCACFTPDMSLTFLFGAL